MRPLCPWLPPPQSGWTYRDLAACRERRPAEFYFAALTYGHTLWIQGHAGRALLALTRALYANLGPEEPILEEWPLPYAALRWILESHTSDDFPGNPRVSFQHQATRLEGPRQLQRRTRAWAAWALVRKARPQLPADTAQAVREPSDASIARNLRKYGNPNEAELWQSVLCRNDAAADQAGR